jgi:FeS assembly SUF system protein
MTQLFSEREAINFGDLPEDIDALLQQGVAAYRHDRALADQLFRQALAAAPTQLPTYFCLYKIHTYQGRLEEAQIAAEHGLKEAAAQAGWDTDWRQWQPEPVVPDGPGRFALYTQKALAFIHLRQDDLRQANQLLDALRRLDPTGAVGWQVVAALADGVTWQQSDGIDLAEHYQQRNGWRDGDNRMTVVDARRTDAASPTLASDATGTSSGLIERIIAALRTVHDPEIPVNIYDLGLIYRIEPTDRGVIKIDMTLTAPGCPVAGEMLKWVENAVAGVEGISSVDVKLVFDPPWDKSRMSEDVQLELGLI